MINKIASQLFSGRIKQIDRFNDQAEEIQRKELRYLIDKAANTAFGNSYNFKKLDTAEAFAETVPVHKYEHIHPYAERMILGEKDVLWPGRVRYFAQSSGTTDTKSKFIPISEESFKTMHYQGGSDTVALYLNMFPDSKLFHGKNLTIGGGRSVKNEYGSHIGFLSGMLVEKINPLVNLIRTPGGKIARISNFDEKMEMMIPKIIKKDIVSISGIPSWYQILFSRVIEHTGVDDLSTIWPNLEVFFHGGVSFEPYKQLFKKMISSPNMHYMEVYNASEGFFSMQNDLSDPGMLLMLDYKTYYEFIPLDEEDSEHPTVLPLWKVELGVSYAMIISNNSGLWRYSIGDVVTFTSKNPYKIVISGRTRHFLNYCGEELMLGNAEKGIGRVSELFSVNVLNFSATVVYATEHSKARHQWMIEFDKAPDDLLRFQETLDNTLCDLNSDYEAKRDHSIALERLEIIVARKGLFSDWMKKHQKMGGQQKIPRLSQKRDFMDELIEMNQ